MDNLRHSTCPPAEVIVVDSGKEKLRPGDYAACKHPPIIFLESSASVCAQRNLGIRSASSPWIFICDDDMEVPADYLEKLFSHAARHPEAGAVSGIVLQKENGQWKGSYPISSSRELLFKFTFGLGIWGEVDCDNNNWVFRKIRHFYTEKGNHIARSGWPVITEFSGDYFVTPIYGLGASLIRKDWLVASPYDEYLDSHGIGDHYGVAAGFPGAGIQVVTSAVVYHHHSDVNRLQHPRQYFLRILALDYFLRRQPRLSHISKGRLLWSLSGNLLLFLKTRELEMIGASIRSIYSVASGRNPYYRSYKSANQPALKRAIPALNDHSL